MEDERRPSRKRPFEESGEYDPNIHGESSNRLKRVRRGRFTDIDDDEEMMDIPMFAPEITENIMLVSGDRETMYNLAVATGNVAMQPTRLEYDGLGYKLRTGQLHPRLWRKYLYLLLRDMHRDNEVSSRTGRRAEGCVSIEEFVRDTRIRLDHHMANSAFDSEEGGKIYEEHFWRGNIVKIARGANRYMRQFGRATVAQIAHMIRDALDRDLLEWEEEAGKTYDASTANLVVGYFQLHGHEVLLFAYKAERYYNMTLEPDSEQAEYRGIKIGRYCSFEDLVYIIWACLHDEHRYSLTARHPLLLELNRELIDSVNHRNQGRVFQERQCIMGHYLLLARLMLERNKDIMEGAQNGGIELCPANSICEMISSAIVAEDAYDAEGGTEEVNAVFTVPPVDNTDLPPPVPFASPAGFAYFGILLHGTPCLYDMLQRYMVVDVHREIRNRVNHFAFSSLYHVDVGWFATVPLALAVARKMKAKRDEARSGIVGAASAVSAQVYLLYVNEMLTVTLHSADAAVRFPWEYSGWVSGTYEKFCKHIRYREQIAWEILFPEENIRHFAMPIAQPGQGFDVRYNVPANGMYYNSSLMYVVFKGFLSRVDMTPHRFLQYLPMFPDALIARFTREYPYLLPSVLQHTNLDINAIRARLLREYPETRGMDPIRTLAIAELQPALNEGGLRTTVTSLESPAGYYYMDFRNGAFPEYLLSEDPTPAAFFATALEDADSGARSGR